MILKYSDMMQCYKEEHFEMAIQPLDTLPKIICYEFLVWVTIS